MSQDVVGEPARLTSDSAPEIFAYDRYNVEEKGLEVVWKGGCACAEWTAESCIKRCQGMYVDWTRGYFLACVKMNE